MRAQLPVILFVCSVVSVSQSLHEKTRILEQNLTERHMLDGLYVSIVPAAPPGAKVTHTVDDPGNVIHAGVWTGRYLAGVGYQYAVTHDAAVRRHGGEILQALRVLQEVTGKPGLLARGYVKGHGPVEGFERNGDSREWHQGQGKYAGYRFYSDVSVDNFNAVLYGYAIYYDLAANAAQKAMIAHDVDRLMTHLLDNDYRIIDLDGEVTQYGHVGIDPNTARDEYYKKVYARTLARYSTSAEWRPSLRACLMALPDLLIAHHITGKPRYIEEYRKVVARFRDNPEPARQRGAWSLERVARVNHSSEGQAYEALFNLMLYEKDAVLLKRYREWLTDLWDMNWMEGNSLFTYMTLALTPPGNELAHRDEALRLANETLQLFPVDRVLRPVMNSRRSDLEPNPFADRGGQKQAAKPLPIHQRPHDNEYAWKGNPYQMDGWLKPAITAFQVACDDPAVAWFSDATGRVYVTRDSMKTWRDASYGLMGARVKRIVASPVRTFVVYAETDRGIVLTRDGGLSWRSVTPDEKVPAFPVSESIEALAMDGWRIPVATFVGAGPGGSTIAAGPGGAYITKDRKTWTELRLWPELETGAADFLHAYWMGRYYHYLK